MEVGPYDFTNAIKFIEPKSHTLHTGLGGLTVLKTQEAS